MKNFLALVILGVSTLSTPSFGQTVAGGTGGGSEVGNGSGSLFHMILQTLYEMSLVIQQQGPHEYENIDSVLLDSLYGSLAFHSVPYYTTTSEDGAELPTSEAYRILNSSKEEPVFGFSTLYFPALNLEMRVDALIDLYEQVYIVEVPEAEVLKMVDNLYRLGPITIDSSDAVDDLPSLDVL